MSEKRMVYAEDVIQRIRDLAPEILGGWYNPDMENELEQLVCVPADELLETACMSKETAEKYLKGRDGCGWHISDLKIYDHPRPLSDFTRLRATKFGYEPVRIEHPPQSWFYVEEKP